MTINMTLTNPGTRLSCAAEVAAAQRPGTGVSVSAHEVRGTRRVMRRWTTGDVVVFTDATLMAIAEQRPADEAALVSISGIGATKLERFGAEILGVVRASTGS